MNIYNSKSFLESNGINDPENTELYNICLCLNSINININKDGPWIVGGSLIRTLCKNPLDTDIDIFFKDDIQFLYALTNLENNAKLKNESEFSRTFEFSFEHNKVESYKKIQLVHYVYNQKVENILKSFDLNICQIAFDGENIIEMNDAIESIKNKKMKLLNDNVTHPGSTLKRIVKYVSRGFEVSTEDLDAFNKKFLYIPGYDNTVYTMKDRY